MPLVKAGLVIWKKAAEVSIEGRGAGDVSLGGRLGSGVKVAGGGLQAVINNTTAIGSQINFICCLLADLP